MTSFKSRVERSSIGTRQSQAARQTVNTRTAAQIVSRASGGTSQQNSRKKTGDK